MSSPTHLYRHFDESGKLLYVGISLIATLARADLEAELESLRNDAWQPIETAPKDCDFLGIRACPKTL